MGLPDMVSHFDFKHVAVMVRVGDARYRRKMLTVHDSGSTLAITSILVG